MVLRLFLSPFVCRSGGVALRFLSPHLIKLWGFGGGGRWLSTLSGSRSRVSCGVVWVMCLVVYLWKRYFRLVPLLYMRLGFNGCTQSRVGELEAAIFNTLLRTTASSVTRSSSCCRVVVFWVS
ncbi:hypothetical protein Bca101_004214 [Brassica carinata]